MAAVETKGRILRDEVVEPRGRTAFTIDAGQTVRIVDLDGQQVADFVCFVRDDPSEKLSVHNTALIQGQIYVTTGHALLSDRCRRLMAIGEDTCGRHDLLAGSCSEGTNRVRYGIADTPNCRSNFEAALRPFGIPLKEVPYSFNVFMNVPIEADGRISIQPPVSKPGDHIDLRAEVDLIVGISNCPQERNPCNAFKPTRLRVQVYAAA
jgi:urea carboxylase-associated protein 1